MNLRRRSRPASAEAIDAHADEIAALGEDIRLHPELGFKEFRTAGSWPTISRSWASRTRPASPSPASRGYWPARAPGGDRSLHGRAGLGAGARPSRRRPGDRRGPRLRPQCPDRQPDRPGLWPGRERRDARAGRQRGADGRARRGVCGGRVPAGAASRRARSSFWAASPSSSAWAPSTMWTSPS